jgi:hypothetical protein
MRLGRILYDILDRRLKDEEEGHAEVYEKGCGCYPAAGHAGVYGP